MTLTLACGDISGKDDSGKISRQLFKHQKLDTNYLSGINTESSFVPGNDDWFEYKNGHYLQKAEAIFIPFEYIPPTHFNTNREISDNKLE